MTDHDQLRRRPTRQTATPEPIRIGMIVPSSNVTMEREVPAMLRARAAGAPERFGFHTSRVRMRSVTPDELALMNAQAGRAAGELADADVDVVAYACLVAVMAEGPGAHRQAEARIGAALADEGCAADVVTSAGALVQTLHDTGLRRVAVIAPYAPALTERVLAYLAAEGIDVAASHSLGVTDNAAVGRLDPSGLVAIARDLADGAGVDAVVASACVQMPSLAVLDRIEATLGIPVLSAASATTFQILRRLGLPTRIVGAGRLLSGAYDAVAPAIDLAPIPPSAPAPASASAPLS